MILRGKRVVFVRLIAKHLADGSVKTYPYRYKSVRTKDGKVRSIYLGPAPVESV